MSGIIHSYATITMFGLLGIWCIYLSIACGDLHRDMTRSSDWCRSLGRQQDNMWDRLITAERKIVDFDRRTELALGVIDGTICPTCHKPLNSTKYVHDGCVTEVGEDLKNAYVEMLHLGEHD